MFTVAWLDDRVDVLYSSLDNLVHSEWADHTSIVILGENELKRGEGFDALLEIANYVVICPEQHATEEELKILTAETRALFGKSCVVFDGMVPRSDSTKGACLAILPDLGDLNSCLSTLTKANPVAILLAPNREMLPDWRSIDVLICDLDLAGDGSIAGLTVCDDCRARNPTAHIMLYTGADDLGAALLKWGQNLQRILSVPPICKVQDDVFYVKILHFLRHSREVKTSGFEGKISCLESFRRQSGCGAHDLVHPCDQSEGAWAHPRDDASHLPARVRDWDKARSSWNEGIPAFEDWYREELAYFLTRNERRGFEELLELIAETRKKMDPIIPNDERHERHLISTATRVVELYRSFRCSVGRLLDRTLAKEWESTTEIPRSFGSDSWVYHGQGARLDAAIDELARRMCERNGWGWHAVEHDDAGSFVVLEQGEQLFSKAPSGGPFGFASLDEFVRKSCLPRGMSTLGIWPELADLAGPFELIVEVVRPEDGPEPGRQVVGFFPARGAYAVEDSSLPYGDDLEPLDGVGALRFMLRFSM